MIQVLPPDRFDAAPPNVVGPLSVDTSLYHLQANDVFEFIDAEVGDGNAPATRLPSGKLRVSVQPWGPKTRLAGPIGPWMFACRDSLGVERHFALPPKLVVRLWQRVAKA